MSFLAQLRQQRADTPQGWQLCYLVTIDATRHRAQLGLVLAELHQGQLRKPGKAYQPQREHLLAPPPFIQQSDLPLLRKLISPETLVPPGAGGGQLPKDERGINGLPLLTELLLTQRCFFSLDGNRWQLASVGKEASISPRWQIQADGTQTACWQHDPAATLFFLDQPLLFNPHSGRVLPSTGLLNPAAITAFTEQIGPLAANAVASFIGEHQRDWSSLGLPLPTVLPRRLVESRITPLLRLVSSKDSRADGGWRNELQLHYRYCSDGYCMNINPGAPLCDSAYWDGDSLIQLSRQAEEEQARHRQLQAYLGAFSASANTSTSPRERVWVSSSPLAWKSLLVDSRKELEQAGFSFLIDKQFRYHYVSAERWQVQLKGQHNEPWSLAINLQLDPQTDSQSIDLHGLLNRLHTLDFALDQQHSCLKLDDGRLLLLPGDKLHGLADELADLLGSGAGEFQFNSNQLARLDSIQRLLPQDTQWLGDTALLDRAQAIHQQPQSIATDQLPLNAQLRGYQQTGICWLQHIKQHQVHGLLADDMGLGKTLQAIAHLCLEKLQGNLRQPALVIAPTSLLYNWAAEISRFAPQLCFQIIHGALRHQHWPQLHQYDLLITSYALVARDLSCWQQQALSWVILDEAQIIKNPRTKIRRAVVQLDCQYRLCLSGTPIQNHLGELWSIFDFLMPGCLGSEREFKQFFRKPIEEQADETRFQQLLKRISPFMLRRSKDQVAADLPRKTEVDQSIIMDSDQQALYDEVKTSSWWQLQQDMGEQSNSGKQQIQVLAALLKLRQVCCDPQLIGEPTISSAKRRHCIEMISELVAEQRSMLVFSQFTSMLDLLARDLHDRNIPYLMLTGESQNRQQRVDAFQAGEAPVFLISLKAGGVGLNLTRADTVIHYDPWWNSSAQQQATDRAHRIGQDKPVFVYKLIMQASIEEKIARLQLRKAQLGKQIGEQAQHNSEQFALKLNELLALIQDD